MTQELDPAALRLVAARMRELQRSFSALRDGTRLAHHRLVEDLGWQWRFPDAVLTDEEIEAIEARRFARTLAAIDDLPETAEP